MDAPMPASLPGTARRGFARWLPALALAGCAEGYPTGDAVVRDATAPHRVEMLNRVLGAGEEVATTVSLRGPCLLEVAWDTGRTVVFPLPELETLVDTVPATGHFVVRLRSKGSAGPGDLLLKTAHWADMTSVRSNLNQLRAHCAHAGQRGN